MRFLIAVFLFPAFISAADSDPIARMAESRIVFPPSLKVEDIGEQFGVKGDGVTDDTAALQEAINRPAAFVYLPNGTYLISDRLIYDHGPSVGPTIVGESRDGVIFKLAPEARGFGDPENPRAVLRTVPDKKVSADFFKIRVRNLTIDCGEHRGAVGLQFYSNNNGHCRNVRIIGKGRAGLDLSHDLNGPLLVSHLVVEGFETGILAGSGPYNSQTLEHLHLSGQSHYAVQNEGECLSIRGLISENQCPALLAGGNTVLVDSQLNGGDNSVPAIRSGGSLFLRNIRVSEGYNESVREHEYHWKHGLGAATETSVPTGLITEWVHQGGSSQWRKGSEISSLNLEVEDPPRVPAPSDFSQWVCVDDFGGDGTDQEDDTAAVKAAFQFAKEHGKQVIAFSAGGEYRFQGTFEVSGSIERIQGAASRFRNERGKPIHFKVVEGGPPVVSFDLFCKSLSPHFTILLENASSRTVVSDSVRGELLASGSGKTFLQDSCHEVEITNPDAKVWVRQLNSESPEAVANQNRGGQLWVLGLKSEKTPTLIATSNRGKTEVLGTWAYVISKTVPENPLWIVHESEASFAGIIQWHHQKKFYDTLVTETQDGETRNFTREKNGGMARLPLYRSK